MVHFLRTKDNKTIIECEVTKDDLSSALDVSEYSNLLLSNDNKDNLIDDFSDLDDIRGWWWEKEEMMGDWKSIDEFVSHHYKIVALKYNLNYITD